MTSVFASQMNVLDQTKSMLTWSLCQTLLRGRSRFGTPTSSLNWAATCSSTRWTTATGRALSSFSKTSASQKTTKQTTMKMEAGLQIPSTLKMSFRLTGTRRRKSAADSQKWSRTSTCASSISTLVSCVSRNSIRPGHRRIVTMFTWQRWRWDVNSANPSESCLISTWLTRARTLWLNNTSCSDRQTRAVFSAVSLIFDSHLHTNF